jgi:hypothetical protein
VPRSDLFSSRREAKILLGVLAGLRETKKINENDFARAFGGDSGTCVW